MEPFGCLAASIPDLIIDVPNRRTWFSLHCEDLPRSLADDIDNWLSREEGRNRRAEPTATQLVGPSGRRRTLGTRRRRKSIRPSTAKSYRALLLSFVTMEIKAGIALESLQTLSDVLSLDHVDRGLSAYQQHFEGLKRRHLGQVMRVLCII